MIAYWFTSSLFNIKPATKVALVLCTVLVTSAARSQQTVAPPSTNRGELVGPISGASPSLRREVQCMVNVLGRMRRVDHIRFGVSRTDGVFVEYRYHESNGQYAVVQFLQFGADESAKSQNSLRFVTTLSGLMTPGGPGPPDFGTTKVERLWKLNCHVNAYDRFE